MGVKEEREEAVLEREEEDQEEVDPEVEHSEEKQEGIGGEGAGGIVRS